MRIGARRPLSGQGGSRQSGDPTRAGGGIDGRARIAQAENVVAATVNESSARIETPDELELSVERPRREDAVVLLDVATRSLDGDVRRAEHASDEQRYEDAIAILRDLPSSLVAAAHPSFRVRVVLAE